MSIRQTEIRKGMRLVFDRRVTLHKAQGYGRMTVEPDTEITVTGTFNGFGYGRLNSGGWSWRFDYDDVHLEHRSLGTPPEGALAPDDERVVWMFQDAARMADRLGLCADFDRLVDALGFPGRLRTWKLESEADGIKATFEIKAHSRREALEKVSGKLGVLPPLSKVKAITA